MKSRTRPAQTITLRQHLNFFNMALGSEITAALYNMKINMNGMRYLETKKNKMDNKER